MNPRRRYFNVAWEAPDDTGTAPTEDASPDDALAVEDQTSTPAAPAPVTFTAEQLAEHLPQFGERFLAHHDPSEALRLYGERHNNVQAALTRYTQGAPTDADVETLRESGYEIPEAAEEEPEPIFGAPWAPMQDWDRIEAYALSDNAAARKMAAEAMWQMPDAPDEYKQWALSQWHELDQMGANQFWATKQNESQNESLLAPLREEIEALRAQIAPVQQQYASSTNEARQAKLNSLITLAQQQVPEFESHQAGVQAIVQRQLDAYHAQGRDPVTYFDEILALPLDQQIRYLGELTGAAAWNSRPEVQAQAQADAAATTAAKIQQGSERGRTAPAGGTTQSEKKREFTASFERLRDIEIPIH